MPSFSTHVVRTLLSEREGFQRVELDSGRRAYVLTRLVGAVAVGDRVVVNTTAVDRGLGTGGWDVVHWNLAREEWSEPGPGHVMKLRYTSLQTDAGAGEELPAYREDHLGLPVVACTLHSQLGCIAAVFKHLAPDRRLVYVMTDGGALPLAMSDLAWQLREAGLVDATVTAGHAFGGDYEAVSVHSALHVAKTVAGADAVVAGMGPGGVGTGRRLGFSGVEAASILDAATALGGQAIAAVRYSEADPRPRHRGFSHHVLTALSLAHPTVAVPVPAGGARPEVAHHRVVEVEVPDVPTLLDQHGVEVTSMGRTAVEDASFYAYAGAAGVLAASLASAP